VNDQLQLLQPKAPSLVSVEHGLCQDVLKAYPDNHFGAMVTDPPYGLSAPPDIRVVLEAWLAGESYVHGSKGFMGKAWDSFVPGPEVWSEVFRVMKPGAFCVVFTGQRTADLMGIALRLAGFEIRDLGAWLYWSGFPKSLDVSKAFDADVGAEREVVGKYRHPATGRPHGDFRTDNDRAAYGSFAGCDDTRNITAPASPEAVHWSGFGTALKPAAEPFIICRKPLEGTYVQNLRKWGVGALNIDGCRYAYGDKAWPGPQENSDTARPNGHSAIWDEDMPQGIGGGSLLGRWPANVYACPKASRSEREAGCDDLPAVTGAEATGSKEGQARLDSPRTGAGRTADEVRNSHPTVKALDLMRWLVRLVTPPGQMVLDPFLGSGTTMCAALRERRDGLGIEADVHHVAICEARMGYHRGKR